ncbi:hypothetical protein SCAR479_01149 [Seiridium cardinale]|uniref:Uncharacterized protein n=1 Tax=Seiridium cardinale TaxID=138064 RepID=A0ABR2Y7U6_9PEZI
MTMLLVNPHEVQPHTYYMNYRPATPSAPTVHHILSMPSQHREHQQSANCSSSYNNNTVAQALEIARESPDGAMDPTVSGILEGALAQIWAKVQAHPNSYIMSRDEFAVFNYFQHRFEGNKTATAARRRYWDNAKGT